MKRIETPFKGVADSRSFFYLLRQMFGDDFPQI